ncbi:hypothetical protein ASNO1_52260 [Corallococcus caeni]|uniref:Uncharacterized protein n=1 Tax=Corallococcus caeni TaxID=3082388 RepID=A0ABQ6QY78_9BACT|nr:hypothetical protein ASNO1_52260 [Corallococcus sp. NO1]
MQARAYSSAGRVKLFWGLVSSSAFRASSKHAEGSSLQVGAAGAGAVGAEDVGAGGEVLGLEQAASQPASAQTVSTVKRRSGPGCPLPNDEGMRAIKS